MNLQLTELSDLNMFSPFSLSTAVENIIQEGPEVNTTKVVHLNFLAGIAKSPMPAVPVTHIKCPLSVPITGAT